MGTGLRKLTRWSGQHIRWSPLRTFGNSKLVATSVIWLFFVPTAAKLLAPIAGERTWDIPWLPAGQNKITFDIALPFSWKLFYLMAWCFFIGQAIFWLACPEIVRRYGSYGEYKGQHGAYAKLGSLVHTAARRASYEDLKRIATEADMQFINPGEAIPKSTRDELAEKYIATNLHPDRLQHYPYSEGVTFDTVLELEERGRRGPLCVSGFFFAAGLLLLAWVVIESVVAVCRLL